MNIFEFSQISIFEAIYTGIFICIAMITYSSIGRYIIKTNICLQSIVGMAFIAMLISILISFNAYIAKYIIISSFILSIIMSIFNYKKFINIDTFKSILLINIIFIILFIIYYKSVGQKIPYIYNSHEPYFLGTSLEIFLADYSNRIRIFDNFPLIYQKYHFFNSCFISIPLLLFTSKNILTANIAKLIICSYFLASIIKYFSRNKTYITIFFCISTTILYISYIFPITMRWSLISNNYSPLFFTTMVFIFFRNQKYIESLIFCLIASSTVSRSILPSYALILMITFYITYTNYKNISFYFIYKSITNILKQNYIRSLFIFTSIISTFVMVLTGTTEHSSVSLHLSNFFSEGWLYPLPPAMSINFKSIFDIQDVFFSNFFSDSPASPIYFSVFISLYAVYLIHIKISNTHTSEISLIRLFFLIFLSNLFLMYLGICTKIGKFWISIILLIINYIFLTYNVKNDYIKKYIHQIYKIYLEHKCFFIINIVTSIIFFHLIPDLIFILYYYIIPLLLIFTLQDRNEKHFFIVFYIISSLQIAFLNPGISFPNYFVFNFILFTRIFCNFYKINFSIKFKICSIFLIHILLLSKATPLNYTNMFAFSKKDRCTQNLLLKKISYKNTIYCFELEEYENTAKMNTLLGNRVTYMEGRKSKDSMSVTFTKKYPGYEIDIQKICKKVNSNSPLIY